MTELNPAAQRAIQQVLNRGNQIRTVLLYGPNQDDIETAARDLVLAWVGKTDGSIPLDRIVDLQVVEPAGASRLISIDAFQERSSSGDSKHLTIPLLNFFRTRPLMFPHKVAWIREADRVTGRAANAGLKLLEELPEHGRIVLTTTNFSRVLPTIRSRCICIACGSAPSNNPIDPPASKLTDRPIEVLPAELQAIVSELWQILNNPQNLSPANALATSEKARQMSAKWADCEQEGARSANAKLMEMIARWGSITYPEYPHFSQAATESYRAIIGNANAALVFDSYFSYLAVTLAGTLSKPRLVKS